MYLGKMEGKDKRRKREGKLDKQMSRMTHRMTEGQERKANEKD
jgi:hypothetical protein